MPNASLLDATWMPLQGCTVISRMSYRDEALRQAQDTLRDSVSRWAWEHLEILPEEIRTRLVISAEAADPVTQFLKNERR